MDNTIADRFKEKNSEILVNKIIQDIENNDDSLRLSLKTKIPFAAKILAQKVNKFLKTNNINGYDFKDLSIIFDEVSAIIETSVFDLLDKRKEKIKEYISQTSKITEDELTNFLDAMFSELKENLNIIMNNIIYVDLPEKLKAILKIHTEEQYNAILEDLLNKYDFNISGLIEDSIEYRNLSLKNLVLETNSKVNELNDITQKKYSK